MVTTVPYIKSALIHIIRVLVLGFMSAQQLSSSSYDGQMKPL